MSAHPPDPDPRGQIPLADGDRSRPRFLSHAELLSSPITAASNTSSSGQMHIRYGGLAASNARCSLIAVLIGQRIAAHAANVEHIIVVLTGALDYVVDGERFRLSVLDQLFIPADVTFDVTNVALETSQFLSIICPVDNWPVGGPR